MRLEIEEKTVIGVRQQQSVVILITQQRDSHAMGIVTEIALNVLIWISGLHRIDSSHQSGTLVNRVTVHHDILHDGTQFLVTTGVQPRTDSPIIEVADGHFLVIEQQGNQFVDIVSHEILVRIHDETLVFQEGRRKVNLWAAALEPVFHLLITPAVGRIDNRQSLHNHSHPLRQFMDMGQTTFILLTHHHPFIGTHRRLAQPQGHQTDTKGVVVGGRSHLHHTVDHIRVHLWGRINRRTGLRGLVSLAILIQDTGDTEVSKYQFCMFLVPEEEVAGLDILMQNVTLMTISKGCRPLEGYTTELVHIPVQTIVSHRPAGEVFHQLVVPVLTVHIGLTEVIHLDNHLKVEVIDRLQDFPVDIEIRIVDLQHEVLSVALHQKHLCLTGVITQRLHIPIVDAFQHEEVVLNIRLVGCDAVSPHSTAHSPNGTTGNSYSTIQPCRPLRNIIVSTHHLSSLISFFVFLPRITHLPPIWGLAQPQGLEWRACLKLHSQASRTPCGLQAIA